MGARRVGLLYAVLASLAVSVSSALVKSSRMPIGQTSFISSSIMFLVSFLVALYKEEIIFPKGQRMRLLVFAVLTGLVLVWDYEAMRLMPLGDEVVVSYTSVVFTILLARVFLKEACGRSKLFCAVLIILGVGFIYKSDESSSVVSYPRYQLGLFLTLFGALFDAATYIFIKELSELHLSVILIYCGCASMVIAGPLHLIENWGIPEEPMTLVSITVLTLLQEVLLYMAVSSGEEASLVSLVQASDIVFSYLWEVSFFREPHTLLRMLGAGLVSLGVCLAAFASDSPEEEGYRPLFKDMPLFDIHAKREITRIPAIPLKKVVKWIQPGKAEKL